MMGLGPRAVFCASRVRHLLAACILVGAALSSASTAPVVNTSEDSLKVIATVTVGSGPQGLAVTPNGNEVYVANYLASTVSVISTASDSVIATVALGSLYGPTDVAIAPDGATAFILVGGNIVAISTSSHAVVNTFSAGPSFGTGLAITPDGKQLYVANFSGTITIIDLLSYQIQNTLTVGYTTWNVAISPDGKSGYVLATDLNPPIYLAKIDVASQTIVEPQFALIKNGISAAIAISPDSATLYIPEFEKDVLALSATTGQLEKKIVIFTGIGNHSKYYLGGAAISPNGQALYVTETGRRAITTVKTLRGRQVGTPLQVGRQPLGVAISASGSLMYVSSYTGGTVSVVQVGTSYKLSSGVINIGRITVH
jgi:YVTN family beta-propeller protein